MIKKESDPKVSQEIEFQYSKMLISSKNRNLYFVFNGKDLPAAKLFLQGHPVSSRMVYLVVKTPEGFLCADADGIEQIPIMNI